MWGHVFKTLKRDKVENIFSILFTVEPVLCRKLALKQVLYMCLQNQLARETQISRIMKKSILRTMIIAYTYYDFIFIITQE